MPRFVPPDRARRQARGGPSGELSVRLCHERRRTLVAGRDDADPGTLEGVEEPEERLARDGEGVADAGCAELVGDVAADGARPGVDDGLGHLRGGLGSQARRRRRLRLGFRQLRLRRRLGRRPRSARWSPSGSVAARLSSAIGLRPRPRSRVPDRAPSVGSSDGSGVVIGASLGRSSGAGVVSSSVMATALLRSMVAPDGDGQR